jgi:hypothetical protein
MILSVFTLFHVIISLIGIGYGIGVLYGLLTNQRFDRWTQVFLTTTVATSVTGFLFPFHGFQPSYGVGILSLIVLALAIAARYRFDLAGGWRNVYVISSVVALYFNCFVLVVQMFRRIGPLQALAPTQSEPPFQVAQLGLLVLFVVLGIRATGKFGRASVRSAHAGG